MRRTLFFGDLDVVAIERLRTLSGGKPVTVAYSGGKDSVVILDLARRAGIPFKAVYHLTTLDPPEVVRLIRSQDITVVPPKARLVDEASRRRCLPTRRRRWCCEVLKETVGDPYPTVVTALRWAESVRRTRRRLFEPCLKNKAKRYLNPIIDWPTSAVWEYIRERGLTYCSLYDDGYTRLGCVGCPMAKATRRRDLARWPRIARIWHLACERVAATSPTAQRLFGGDPQALWEWWLSDAAAPTDEPLLP